MYKNPLKSGFRRENNPERNSNHSSNNIYNSYSNSLNHIQREEMEQPNPGRPDHTQSHWKPQEDDEYGRKTASGGSQPVHGELADSHLDNMTDNRSVYVFLCVDVPAGLSLFLSYLVLTSDAIWWLPGALLSLISCLWALVSLWIVHNHNMIYPTSNRILSNYLYFRLALSLAVACSLLVCGFVSLFHDSFSYTILSMYYLVVLVYLGVTYPAMRIAVDMWRVYV